MVKFSTKLGRAKRNKKSFAVRKSHEKQLRCKIAREIINAILERVENEKQSTQDCKKILHEILEAASPDGIINEEEIVEVKCLQKIATSELSLLDAVRKKMVPCLKIENEEITLKTNHDYYYQVQGQLNITGASKAYFVIYSGDRNDIFVQIIMKDKTIWEEIMLPKLKEFYLNCVAPEIILNRRGKNLKCKDPDYIIKAQIESQERKRPRKT